jgi:O-antigen/teichoic acid export membrane protein
LSKLASLASGVGWGTVSIAAVTLFQLLFMAIMARLLNPADFGLVAIANVALRFYSYFSQMGIMPALIQKTEVSDGDIRAALSLSLGVSSFFFLIVYFTAMPIERFFEMKSLGLVMQILSFNFVIFAVSSISLGIIRRNKAFKSLAIIEIISYILGYGVVGIGAAFSGAGVWALVSAFLTQSLSSAVIGYLIVRHPLGLSHTSEQRRHFVTYGGRYSIIGFIEFLTSNIGPLLVGKFMGASVAGYYNRAMLLANLPAQQPTKVLTQALFPIMSSISSEHDKQSTTLQLSTLIIGCYALSIGVGISIAASEIVIVLLGDKWLESIPLLEILALAIGPIYISNVMGVTLDSMGELYIKLRIQLTVLTLVLIMLFFVAGSGDPINVALTILIAVWVRLLIMGAVVIRLLKIASIHAVKISMSIVTTASITGATIFTTRIVAPIDSMPAILLFIEILAGAIGLGVGLWVSTFIMSKHPAILYLAKRMPLIERVTR